MIVLADKEIYYVRELFGLDNHIRMCEGRRISAKKLKNVDILIIRSVTEVNSELLCDGFVKFVGTTTAGINHIDQNYLNKNNIKFTFAPGSNAISVVEYVLAALFWLAQRDHFFLRDKTVGIVGVGHIGNLLYQKLHNFGVHTLLCDPYVPQMDSNKNWKSFEKLVTESNILTIHAPLTYLGSYPTWHMVNMDVLDALPSNSILINTARGGIVDNTALLKILQCGKKIRVVLDVWESEPYLLSPLLSYVDIGTAHIAGYTCESKFRSIIKIYNEYCNYFNIIKKVDLSNVSNTYVSYIEVKGSDEIMINQLIQSVYNIYKDHLALKNCVIQLGEFDLLRKCHGSRREWSSLCITTNKDRTDEILANLGFSIV